MRIFRLVLDGLRGRKRDTAVLGGILLLAFLFLTLSSILLASFSETAQLQRQALHGNWKIMYYGAGDEASERLSGITDCARIRLVGNTNDDRLIGSADERVLELGSLQLEEGRMPQGEDEILLVRGRMSQEPAVGETLELVYLYDYMRGGNLNTAEERKQAVLEAVRGTIVDPNGTEFSAEELHERFLSDMRDRYDAESNSISFAIGSGEYYSSNWMLPPDYDLDRALEEMEDDLFAAWATSIFGQTEYGTNTPFRISRVTAKPGGLFGYGGFLINIKNTSFQTTFCGWGYTGNSRGHTEIHSQTGETVLYKSYTVVGYVAPYADHWDVRGYEMPDAFVSPDAADAQIKALRRAEEDYYEGAPSFIPSSILLMSDDASATEPLDELVLPVYSELQQPYFRLEGFAHGGGERQEGFLIGLDPSTGAEKALQLFDYGANFYLQDELGNWRELSGDPTASSRWAEFEDLLLPLQPSVLSIEDLQEGSKSALRLNQYSFPPSNSAEGSVQLLCSGILVGVAAVSAFQVFWVQLRRRRMRLTTLMSIGATDGQILKMLFLEVLVLLSISCVLGTALGFGISRIVVNMLGTVFTVRWTYLLSGIACCLAAVLISASIPMLLVLRAPLTGREQISRSVLRLRPPCRRVRQSYRRILLRQMTANRGRTVLLFTLAGLLALIGLLTVYLCHAAYGNYRRTVKDTAMPDYELVAPYGMSSRYLDTCLESAVDLLSGSQMSVSREAPNVLLHCGSFAEDSPILRTLRELPQATSMFRSLDGEDLGFSVRVVGMQPNSPVLTRILAELQIDSEDRAALESGDACILLVPRFIPEGTGVRLRDVDEDSLKDLREDEKAGVLLDLHYDKLYASTGSEDNAIRAGDVITVTAFSQSLSGERLSEKRVEKKLRVLAVMSTLDEPVWPLSENCASHVVLSGDTLVRTLYPSANTRMTGSQARSHKNMAKIFYPDCYGLTRFTLTNLPDSDPIEQDTAASDFAEEYGFDFMNHRMQKEREETAAQRRWMLFLLLGIEMSLVVATLLYSAAGMALEQDRYRYGTLQALGVSQGQMFWGEALRSFLLAITACVAANLALALLQGIVALFSGRFLQTLLENLDAYPWTAHGLVCLAFVLIFTLLQALPILRVSRLEPIQNIRS